MLPLEIQLGSPKNNGNAQHTNSSNEPKTRLNQALPCLQPKPLQPLRHYVKEALIRNPEKVVVLELLVDP